MHLYLCLQKLILYGILMRQPHPLHLIKMNLEWDETGQSMRLRRGIIEVDGVMPVLVSGHV